MVQSFAHMLLEISDRKSTKQLLLAVFNCQLFFGERWFCLNHAQRKQAFNSHTSTRVPCLLLNLLTVFNAVASIQYTKLLSKYTMNLAI